jgi:hypothetical protein
MPARQKSTRLARAQQDPEWVDPEHGGAGRLVATVCPACGRREMVLGACGSCGYQDTDLEDSGSSARSGRPRSSAGNGRKPQRGPKSS